MPHDISPSTQDVILDAPGCSLLGDAFGLVVQMALALLAFSILTVKYLRERESRDLIDWSMDTGKQAVGSLLAHGWNIIFASALTTHYGSKFGHDPCVYYLMNFVVDSVLGCVGNYVLLRTVEVVGGYFGKDGLRETGNYGPKGKKKFDRFGLQLAVWLWVITVVKVVLLFIVIIPMQKQLYSAGEFLMSSFSPRMELTMVMVFIPVTCNAIVFWATDSFLKKKTDAGPKGVLTLVGDDRQH